MSAARRAKVLNRLRRLEGQVRGLHKMVEEDRECREILTLLSGVRNALDAAGEEILEAYLEKCQAEQSALPQQIVEAVRLLRR